MIDFAKSLPELASKKIHLSEGTIIFLVLAVCVAYIFPAFLKYRIKIKELEEQRIRDQREYEKAMADGRLEERKLTIQEEKARAEAELEWLRICLEHGVALDDLPIEWKSKFLSLLHTYEEKCRDKTP